MVPICPAFPGGAASSMDKLCDRSPEGEVEVARSPACSGACQCSTSLRSQCRRTTAAACASGIPRGRNASATVAMRVELGQHLQRQLELGLALRPQLLLLDEPMAGMGCDESGRMVALLHSLHGEATILLVEHDMDAVSRLADRISTQVRRRIIATGTSGEIRAHPEVQRACLGDELEEIGA